MGGICIIRNLYHYGSGRISRVRTPLFCLSRDVNAGLYRQPFQLSSFWRTDISLQTRYTHFQDHCTQKKELPAAMDRAFLIRNVRFVAFVLAFIVWLWGFYLLSSLAGIGTAPTYLLPLLPALPLLIAAIIFARQSRRLLSGPVLFSNKRQLWMYLGVVALTLVILTIVTRMLQAYHLRQWQWPASIFLVGLHFLGLIPRFQRLAIHPSRDARFLPARPACAHFCFPDLHAGHAFCPPRLAVRHGSHLLALRPGERYLFADPWSTTPARTSSRKDSRASGCLN